MIEKIVLEGRCCYQAKMKVSVFSTGKPSKHRENKIVKFMVYKNVHSNKSLSKYKKTVLLKGRNQPIGPLDLFILFL